MRTTLLITSTLFALVGSACVTSPDAAEDDPLPEILDDKADSSLRPTRHGRLLFGVVDHVTITSSARYHEWRFELDQPAAVTLSLHREVLAVDTVAYLYRREGARRVQVARADDDGFEMMAGVGAELPAGKYTALIKSKYATTRGSFFAELHCHGDGCPEQQCVFASETYADVDRDVFDVSFGNVVTESRAVLLDPQDLTTLFGGPHLREALGVETEEQAFAAVDGGRVIHRTGRELPSHWEFEAFEYEQRGKRTVVVFAAMGREQAARIDDGELTSCDRVHVVPRRVPR